MGAQSAKYSKLGFVSIEEENSREPQCPRIQADLSVATANIFPRAPRREATKSEYYWERTWILWAYLSC